MAPQTRSYGVPPPSRVYHSTPTLQQAQFPSRRKVVRTYGKKQKALLAKDWRQRTLTQIDFVSSSAEPVTVLSDSEEGEFAADKENEGPDEDEEPVSSRRKKTTKRRGMSSGGGRNKRRRTLGDETGGNAKIHEGESRRKTMGDAPDSSYHTQTMTQFFGRGDEAMIRDSEDEDGGFDDWLQEPSNPQQPRRKELDSPSKPAAIEDESEQQTFPQPSFVPQTPAKRTIRFEIPSSSQQSTPASRMLDRYGPPGKVEASPSLKGNKEGANQITELSGKPKPTPGKLVIEDSFASESWGSPPAKGTPLKDITADVVGSSLRRESSSVTEAMSTPTRPRRRGRSEELGEALPAGGSPRRVSSNSISSPSKKSTPKKTEAGLYEIPDSDDEEDGDFLGNQEECAEIKPDEPSADKKPHRGPEEDASSQERANTLHPLEHNGAKEAKFRGFEGKNGYAAGAETQFFMNELASSVDHLSEQPSQRTQRCSASSTAQLSRQHLSDASLRTTNSTTMADPPLSPQLPSPQKSSSYSAETNPTLPLPPPIPTKPIRKPVRHLSPANQTQLESQRVPLATIQSFGPYTDRTDIILPTPPSEIDLIVTGHQVHISLPFQVPEQVPRFWIYDGQLLRYLACVEPGHKEQPIGGRPSWRHHVSQVYELNNPMDEQEMRDLGWVDHGPIGRYRYFPPVGVSLLLANLRHALFGDGDDGGEDDEDEQSQQKQQDPTNKLQKRSTPTPGNSFSISQQVEAQLRCDIAHHTQAQQQPDDAILVPSTPLKVRGDKTPKPQHNTEIRPSQATTVSQSSTPEKSSSFRRPPLPPQSSNGAFIFQDNGNSSLALLPMSEMGVALRSSQLLTKSQMLSDSLICDDGKVPPEICDSDDDEA